jgi:hypothetical protein
MRLRRASRTRHASHDDIITLDFINTQLEAGAPAGIELMLDTAEAVRAAPDRAIIAVELEEVHGQVRGKAARPRPAGMMITNHRSSGGSSLILLE